VGVFIDQCKGPELAVIIEGKIKNITINNCQVQHRDAVWCYVALCGAVWCCVVLYGAVLCVVEGKI
jgi:hypothetical protein